MKKASVLWEVRERYIASHNDITIAEEIYLNIFAPLASVFVEWCINQAVSSGKKRLYFLARDSYPMYVMALRLCKIRNINVDIRILSVSRYALRLPEYHLLFEEAIDGIVIGGIDVTLRKIFRRAGLTDEEGDKVAASLGLHMEEEKILDYGNIMELKCKLRKSDIFLKYIYKHSCEAYPAAIGYMEQMGMLDNVPYGLVDSGWMGTLQKAITNLIRVKKPDFVTEGYYFGLYGLPEGVNIKNYHCFYFSPHSGLRRKVYFSNCLFETVFSQACGMTLGYEIKGEGEVKDYIPKKSKKGNPNSRQLSRNLTVLMRYTDIYGRITLKMSEEEKDRICKKNAAVCDLLLKNFMGKPDRLSVEIYGNSLFCDDMLDGSFLKVARDMTPYDIKNHRLMRKIAVMLGIKRKEFHDSAWIEGSIVRAGVKVRRNLWHVRVYKYILYIKQQLKNNAKVLEKVPDNI